MKQLKTPAPNSIDKIKMERARESRVRRLANVIDTVDNVLTGTKGPDGVDVEAAFKVLAMAIGVIEGRLMESGADRRELARVAATCHDEGMDMSKYYPALSLMLSSSGTGDCMFCDESGAMMLGFARSGGSLAPLYACALHVCDSQEAFISAAAESIGIDESDILITGAVPVT